MGKKKVLCHGRKAKCSSSSTSSSSDCEKCALPVCVVNAAVPVTGTVGVTGLVGITGDFQITVQAGITGSVGLTGPVEIAVGTVVGVTGNVGLTGPVEIAPGTVIGVTGNFGITGSVEIAPGTVIGVTGNVGLTGPVEIAAGTVVGVTGYVGLTGPVGVTGTVDTVLQPTTYDAFGRLRVSNPFTLFDSKTRYYGHTGTTNADISTFVSGSATITNPTSTASYYVLNVANSGVGEAITETLRVFPYQPGKSLQVLCTFSMAQTVAGLTQRVGFYGPNDGIYLEWADGNEPRFVIRRNGAEAESASQSSWNTNTLPSLNLTYAQILWFDVEWLGVGNVRAGFVINGQFIICHVFQHANITGNTIPYMTTAILPIRYELVSEANVDASLVQICQTAISEGGYSTVGTLDSVWTFSPVNINSPMTETYYPILALRLSSSRQDAVVFVRQIDVVAGSTSEYGRLVFLRNPTFSVAPSFSVVPNSSGSVEYYVNTTNGVTVTGGEQLDSFFYAGRTSQSLNPNNAGLNYQLSRSLSSATTYSSDQFVLAILPLVNTNATRLSVGFEELS